MTARNTQRWESAPHDVTRQGKSNASNILLPIIRREEDVASILREGSGQETTGTKRALQEVYGASTNETGEEIR